MASCPRMPPLEETLREIELRTRAAQHCLDVLSKDEARFDRPAIPPAWLERLPDFEGEVVTSGAAVDIAELDFGKVRRVRPAAVLRPRSANDVAKAIRFCRAEGIALAPRGSAHSAGGQMMVADGLVVDMKAMNRILSLEDDACVVEAGALWADVAKASFARGLSPIVVTDWLGVTVGGTISMGGFGFMSFRRGTQMDNLLELEVVTGEGNVVVCSREDSPELFDAVRGTHGKFGIITRARVPLEKSPERVRMIQACYGSFPRMMEDFHRFTQSEEADLVHAFAAERRVASITTRMNSSDSMRLPPDAVQRLADDRSHRWVYNLELVDVLHEGRSRPLVDVASLRHEPGLVDVWELTWEEFCFRSPPLVLEEKFRGAAPHPELCAWVPMQPACIDWVADEFERLDPAADTGNGPILFFPARPDLVSAPLFRMPRHEPYVFFWGLLRRAEPATAERIASQFADNEVLYARALERGAVRYVPDTTPDDDRFWAAHFGPLWETILELKRRYDPDAVLAASFGGAASRASVAVGRSSG